MRFRRKLTLKLLMRSVVAGVLTGVGLYLFFALWPEGRTSSWSWAFAGLFGALGAVLSGWIIKESYV